MLISTILLAFICYCGFVLDDSPWSHICYCNCGYVWFIDHTPYCLLEFLSVRLLAIMIQFLRSLLIAHLLFFDCFENSKTSITVFVFCDYPLLRTWLILELPIYLGLIGNGRRTHWPILYGQFCCWWLTWYLIQIQWWSIVPSKFESSGYDFGEFCVNI